jgi:uncharacterized SAM-binding protein YcdF (DUF218 family)
VRELLLPPGGLLALWVLAIAVRKRHPKAALGLAVAATVMLYLLSIPLVPLGLRRTAQRIVPVSAAQIQTFRPQAIVILGGGAESGAPEYGGRTVSSESTLRRVAYGAHLAQTTGLPILVTGGYGENPQETEAWAMTTNLESYGITVKWSEAEGQNTSENALFSQRILAQSGVERILLVTGATHMPRVLRSFRQSGLSVLAAPTGFATSGPWDKGVMALVPTAHHFQESSGVLRAWLAEIRYRF